MILYQVLICWRQSIWEIGADGIIPSTTYIHCITYFLKNPCLSHSYWLVMCRGREGAEGREEKWEEVELGNRCLCGTPGHCPPSLIASIPRLLLVSVTLPLFTHCVRARRGGREEELQLLASLHRSPCRHEEETTFHSSTPGVYSPFGIMILMCSEAFACLRLDGCIWDLRAQRRRWITMKGSHQQRGCGCQHLFSKLIGKCGCCVGQGRGMQMDSLWLSSMFCFCMF